MERAAVAGVGSMLTICTRLDEFDTVVELAGRYPNVHCSVGVHPHEAGDARGLAAATLIEFARAPKVVGIGETGLDYHYEHSAREDQQASFRAHIAAARETGLPLIVHSRAADGDTAEILAEEMTAGPFPGLIHCFTGGPELAARALDLGLYISFSGIVTFKNAGDLRAVAAEVPLDRLLVETDAPYLAPVPYRGQAQRARLRRRYRGLRRRTPRRHARGGWPRPRPPTSIASSPRPRRRRHARNHSRLRRLGRGAAHRR